MSRRGPLPTLPLLGVASGVLVNAGIVRIVFGTHYPDPRGLAAAEKLGIEVVSLAPEAAR